MHKIPSLLVRCLLVLFLSWSVLPGTAAASDVILPPGYIAGTVTIGDYDISSLSIYAYGNGYSASKSVSGGDYSLTVFSGDWDYSVQMNAYLRTTENYYPYTYLYFKPRTLRVAEGETVVNNYTVTPGVIRFVLTIDGDAYEYWYASYNAYRYVYQPEDQEQTYSYGYTYSYYQPSLTWDMPVVPSEQVQVSATIRVDNVSYNAFPQGKTIDIAAGEVVTIPIVITHTTPTTTPDEYGTVQGTIGLTNIQNLDFHYVYVGGAGAQVASNPGAYLLENVRAGQQYFYAYSYFDNYRTNLNWPCPEGNCDNRYLQIEPGMTHTRDYLEDAGILEGNLLLTGTVTEAPPQNLSLFASGVWSLYDSDRGYVTTPTAGGSASASLNDGQTSYRLFLTPGPWLPYYVSASRYDYDTGAYRSYSFTIFDYNYYLDGGYYDFGQPANITGGGTVTQDREYCTGSLEVRFGIAGGGLISYPQISGNGYVSRPDGKQERYVYASAYSGVFGAESPAIEVHGAAAPYAFTCYATTEDGSSVTFGRIETALECGVRKRQDLYGPSLSVTSPAAGLVTNAEAVIVAGTASEKSGIERIAVNGLEIPFSVSGGPDGPFEATFAYDLAVAPGPNSIIVEAFDTAGNRSSNERIIYVDRWTPSVSISSPADGSIFGEGSQVAVAVQAADRGYGYTVKVYLNGQQIGQTNGPANDAAPATADLYATLSPAAGTYTISAVAEDRAGNSATASSSFVVVTYLDALSVIVKPESRNNSDHGVMTVFVRLPDGLTSSIVLDPALTRETTSSPQHQPVSAKYDAGEDKVVLKFRRTPELMADQFYTLEGRFCIVPADPATCGLWRGSDTTKK